MSSDLMAIGAGAPQGFVLSGTLFLLDINDLLQPGLIVHADDSKWVQRDICLAQQPAGMKFVS